MAATKPTTIVQTVLPRPTSVMQQSAPLPAVFLVKIKTDVGETTQLCKKLVWIDKATGKLSHNFQPLSQSEIMTIFEKPGVVKVVEENIVKGIATASAPAKDTTSVGLIPSIVPVSNRTLNPSGITSVIYTQPLKVAGSKPETVVATKPATVALKMCTITTKPLTVTSKSVSTATKSLVANPKPLMIISKPGTTTTKPITIITKPYSLVNTKPTTKTALKSPTLAVSWKPTISLTDTLTTSSTTKPTDVATTQAAKTTLSAMSHVNTCKTIQTTQASNANSTAFSPAPNLPVNSTVTLRKIPGTDNFVIERVRNDPASSTHSIPKQVPLSVGPVTNGQKIPVGKVLPLQVSISQSSSSRVSQVFTTANSRSVNPISSATSSAHITKDGQIKAKPIQTGVSSKHLKEAHDSSSSAPPAMFSGVSILKAAAKQVDKAANRIESAEESLTSNSCPIPMKITSVADNGNEISVSRDEKTESTMDSETDKTQSTSAVTEPQSKVPAIENTTKSSENPMDDAKKSTTVSVAKETGGMPALQNVYARIYLAPDSQSSEADHQRNTTQEASSEPSLKIDSVFSLNEDQVKEFFPDENTNNNDKLSVDHEITCRTDDTKSPTVQIKQEPPDSPSNDRTFETDNEAVHIKEEPQDCLVKVKEEPEDDYIYTNYPIPNDEEEDTDTASEFSPPRVKHEPMDDRQEITHEEGSNGDVGASYSGSSLSSSLIALKPSTKPEIRTASIASLATGAQLVINGQRLTTAGGQSSVTDIDGKKYIVLSAPGQSISGITGQTKSTGTSRPNRPLLPSSSTGGKSYLVTMANGEKRLVHLQSGTPASSLLSSLSKGKTVQLPVNAVATSIGPVPSPKLEDKSKQYEIIRQGKDGGIIKVVTRRTNVGSTPTTTNASSSVLGPTAKLMQKLISNIKKGERLSAESKDKSQQQALSVATKSESEPIEEESLSDRRRSSRERKHKRRYSPPPIGPVKKRYYGLPKQEDAPKLNPADDESGTSWEDSNVADTEPEPLSPAVTSREDRMRLLKDLIKEKEAALEVMRKRRQKEMEERENDPDLMDL